MKPLYKRDWCSLPIGPVQCISWNQYQLGLSTRNWTEAKAFHIHTQRVMAVASMSGSSFQSWRWMQGFLLDWEQLDSRAPWSLLILKKKHPTRQQQTWTSAAFNINNEQVNDFFLDFAKILHGTWQVADGEGHSNTWIIINSGCSRHSSWHRLSRNSGKCLLTSLTNKDSEEALF